MKCDNTPSNYDNTDKGNLVNDLTLGLKPRFSSEDLISELKKSKAIEFELDTEFESYPLSINYNHTITDQIKAIHRNLGADNPLIFTREGYSLPNVPKRQHSNPIIDYLLQRGVFKNMASVIKNYRVDWDRYYKALEDSKKDCPNKLSIRIWGFFLIADIPKAFMGDELDFILRAMKGEFEKHGKYLEHGRHLRASQTKKDKKGKLFTVDGIDTPFYINLGNKLFQMVLILEDISGAFGNCSYKEAGIKTNTSLEDKSLMDGYKDRMSVAIKEQQYNFIRYALVDLHSTTIWCNWKALVSQVAKEIGINDYWKVRPAKTIGATIKNLFSYYMMESAEHFSDEDKPKQTHPKDWLEDFGTKESNPGYLKSEKHSTKQFLAKIDGGRCHNSKPWLARKKGSIVDIDIDGAYGNAIRKFVYPVGQPVILDYPKKRNSNKTDEKNEYLTLREFLKHYSEDLIKGLWIARVSTPKGYQLKHEQDLIMSWFPPKKIENMTSDSDGVGKDGELNLENDGESKVLKREVHLGAITSDILELIENYCSPQQRKELMDNLLVITACYYPASEEKNDLYEVEDARKTHDGKNTTKIEKHQGKIRKVKVTEDCHAWCGYPMRDYIDVIQEKRNNYRKDVPEEKPLNLLYKDCRNVLYGDLASPYFPISNTVIGNNITARVRTMAWCMEKGLNMFQTITDGGMFDKDRILTENRAKITLENSIEEKGLNEGHLKLKALEGTTKQQLETNAYQHVKSIFGNLTIFQEDVFSLEIKKSEKGDYIAEGVSLHGKGDYCLYYPDSPHYKMRGWNDKLIDNQENHADRRNAFLDNIYSNPKAVERLEPAFESYILKTKEYKQTPSKFDPIWLKPGDTIVKTRQLLECSINAFNFQTKEQKDKWERAVDKLKFNYDHSLNYGQGLEMFYLNKDGSLDYEQMLLDLYRDVNSGKKKPSCLTDKSRHTHRHYKAHPHLEKRLAYKSQELNPDMG